MCARGVSASQPYLVTRICLTPYMPSNAADVAPAGPLPTMSTSVSMILAIVLSTLFRLLRDYLIRLPTAGAEERLPFPASSENHKSSRATVPTHACHPPSPPRRDVQPLKRVRP